MTPYVIRIRCNWLRVLLCILFEPYWALRMIVVWSMPVRWGGHPDGRRIFAPDAWAFHFSMFWAGVDGEFVGVPHGESP